MSIRSINYRLLSVIICVKRSVTNSTNINIGKQMKMLNDKKQFEQALHLFDQNNDDNSIKTCSSLTITQALKACSQIGDLQRGRMIHQLISSRVKDDSYILASLIHLYSEYTENCFCQSYLIM